MEHKRIRRTKEQVITEKKEKLEAKIVEYKTKISAMEKELYDLNNPPAPSVKMKDIKAKADELGMSLDEVMEALEHLRKK